MSSGTSTFVEEGDKTGPRWGLERRGTSLRQCPSGLMRSMLLPETVSSVIGGREVVGFKDGHFLLQVLAM